MSHIWCHSICSRKQEEEPSTHHISLSPVRAFATASGVVTYATKDLSHETCVCCCCVLQLFSTYDCGTEKRVFGVSLAQLVDALSVFASAAKADLHIHYPGPDGELQLE